MKKLLLFLLLPTIVLAQDASLKAAKAWKEKEGYNILGEFSKLLSIPNRASDNENIRKNGR